MDLGKTDVSRSYGVRRRLFSLFCGVGGGIFWFFRGTAVEFLVFRVKCCFKG